MRTHRRLAQTFVNLSQAYRDLVLDFSITLLRPSDVRVLRNRMQGVVRTLLSLKHDTRLFEMGEKPATDLDTEHPDRSRDFVVDIEEKPAMGETPTERETLQFVAGHLLEPTQDLLSAIRVALQNCDAVLMDMCGHRRYLGPPAEIPGDIPSSLVRLRKKMIAFSRCQDDVLNSDRLQETRVDSPEVCLAGFLLFSPQASYRNATSRPYGSGYFSPK